MPRHGRETKFQRYRRARIASIETKRERERERECVCERVKESVFALAARLFRHARAAATVRGCSNFCRCINTAEKQPPSVARCVFMGSRHLSCSRFTQARLSSNARVYTRATCARVHTRLHTRSINR